MIKELSAPETTTARIEFTVWNHTVRAQIPVPAGPARRSDLLPACRALTDLLVEVAVEAASERGEQISCKTGCGACCRQLVPVSEPEARRLADLIEQLPDPRRSEIRARFAAASERLAAAGLLEKLADVERFPYDEMIPFGTDYFNLGIACPFLENESCSIYSERPLICREYLVTSPAVHCGSPTAATIRTVPLPGRASNALNRVGLRRGATHVRWVPLVLAPEWADANPAEPAEQQGPEMLKELFANLTERRKQT